MANKRFGLGILVIALVFGLMVVGCGDSGGGGGGSGPSIPSLSSSLSDVPTIAWGEGVALVDEDEGEEVIGPFFGLFGDRFEDLSDYLEWIIMYNMFSGKESFSEDLSKCASDSDLTELGILQLQGTLKGTFRGSFTDYSSTVNIDLNHIYDSDADESNIDDHLIYLGNDAVVKAKVKAKCNYKSSGTDKNDVETDYNDVGIAISYAAAFSGSNYCGKVIINLGFAYADREIYNNKTGDHDYKYTTDPKARGDIKIYSKDNVQLYAYTMPEEEALALLGF